MYVTIVNGKEAKMRYVVGLKGGKGKGEMM